MQDILDRLHLRRTNKRKFTILDGISGVIKPGAFTLLLGPPGSGKTTLLTALAGKLQGVGGLKVRAAAALEPLLLLPCLDADVLQGGGEPAHMVPLELQAYIIFRDT